jgi:hypothetical protein
VRARENGSKAKANTNQPTNQPTNQSMCIDVYLMKIDEF